MSRRALIVDAGVGNLGNLRRALERIGSEVEITADPDRIAAEGCLLLPGVGAFAPPRETLRGPLEAALRAALDQGAFLLGICVGFQLLFESGEEWKAIDGLGLLPGRVTRLPPSVPVPHIGWNRLHDLAEHPLVAGLETRGGWGEYVYSSTATRPRECRRRATSPSVLMAALFRPSPARDG